VSYIQHENSAFLLHWCVSIWFVAPIFHLLLCLTFRSSYVQWTSSYRSGIIRFPGSVVQFLWSLSKSYFNYGSRIYCFPGSIVSFSDPQRKRWIEVPLYFHNFIANFPIVSHWHNLISGAYIVVILILVSSHCSWHFLTDPTDQVTPTLSPEDRNRSSFKNVVFLEH
jgi:hypothetical protein